MLKGFGFDNLEQCGAYLGLPKLKKPDYLGIRRPTEQEHNYFIEYSARDAIVTSKIVQWLLSLGVDPARLATAGTLAAKVFDLPKRLKRNGRYYELSSPLEQNIKNACFAGRNEAFVTGLTPYVTYHDVKSLYPCSVIATKALTITGAKECYADEVVIGDEVNYGWLQGTFESSNDVWGIPYRLVYDNNHYRNHYVTGKVTGLFHSLDLAAAKVKVHEIAHAYKPTNSNDKTIHAKYAKMLLDRIDNKSENEDRKRNAKAVLNALTGKIGASHPITETSNFFAYSTILAHSHYIMSRLFEMYRQYLLGTDTDSLFLTADFTGHKFDVTDGEYTIPIILDNKGTGDLALFRSKLYMLLTKEQQDRLARQQEIFSTKPVYARAAWVYFAEDFFKLFDGTKTNIETRRDIKHTFATRIKEALEMAKGRWRTKRENVDLSLLATLNADMKRVRDSYDSYKLIQERRSMPSRAWAYDELVNTTSMNADLTETAEDA